MFDKNVMMKNLVARLDSPSRRFAGTNNPTNVGDKYSPAKAAIDRLVTTNSGIYKPKIETNLNYVKANDYHTT